ncbi:hypothetical protein GXW82_01360 [Streptacidiphilus sp. 4-A2]|nr:hypothetical protein [Streptacidiphilus sp. 4-A2]
MVRATALGFVRYRDAVQWPSVSDYVPPGEGLQMLLPDGPCVLGIGTFQNGYRGVGANWRSSPGCDRLTLSPAPGSGDPSSGGDGPPAQSAAGTAAACTGRRSSAGPTAP